MMLDAKRLATFSRRAIAARLIARGIFDRAERRALLAVITDAEKLAANESAKRKRRPSL